MPIWIRGLCVCIGSEGHVFLCRAHIGSIGCVVILVSERCSVCVGSEVCMLSVGSEGSAPITGEGCVSLLILRCVFAPVLGLRGVCSYFGF